MVKWRVVAIRRNGCRIVLDEHLWKNQAEDFRARLVADRLFPSVFIERDIQPASPLPLGSNAGETWPA